MINSKENCRYLNICDLCLTHDPISRFHSFAKFLRTRSQNDNLITQNIVSHGKRSRSYSTPPRSWLKPWFTSRPRPRLRGRTGHIYC
jgi:hypothetical protein